MKRFCLTCIEKEPMSVKKGSFVRRSDGRRLKRFKCLHCKRTFSAATFQLCYRQKKRNLNPRIYELLCSGVSQRRIAKLLNISRTTVVRKFLFLSKLAMRDNFRDLSKIAPVQEVQFDDLETIEHTKCKPLSVAMAVEKHSRKILGFSVSRMPAKGHLAKIARKKYGRRPDERKVGWNNLFSIVSCRTVDHARIESDQNPHYPEIVRKWCPNAKHVGYPGERGCVAGQGELKKVYFDPLFTLNHTFAMCRANINRLFRKTWCTTKRPDRLAAHLELYMHYHNRRILPNPVLASA